IFHCFGCGVGGDIFGFLMRQDRLSFPEAVRALAKTAGVTLPEDRGGQPGDSGREELFRVMDLAARFYAEALWKPAGERARKNLALIVEGYVDCLMAHQHGFTETVAALGTAFTPAQLALLRRYCDEVVTFFDADAAGQKAAERAEELLDPTTGGIAWAVNRSGGFDG